MLGTAGRDAAVDGGPAQMEAVDPFVPQGPPVAAQMGRAGPPSPGRRGTAAGQIADALASPQRFEKVMQPTRGGGEV